MSDITLITPPDHIFSDAYNFFLIYPSENIKQQFNSIIADKQDHFNVYLYEPDSENQDPKWLLSTINIADTIILDVDNSLPQIGDILAYWAKRDPEFILQHFPRYCHYLSVDTEGNDPISSPS